jgi:hypothetical protein
MPPLESRAADSATTAAEDPAREPTAAERVKALVKQGWEALEQDQPQQAMLRFRQALRIRPSHPGAQAGIVESLKARHRVYRWLLARVFALGRLPPAVQIGLMVVAFLALRILSSVVAVNPQWGPVVWPLLLLIFGGCVLIGLATPIFTMLLSLDPDAREALSDDERRGATALLGSLLLPLPVLLYSLFTNTGLGLVVWILLTMVALPASAIYRCASGWPRWIMIAVTIVVIMLIMPLLVSVFGDLPGINEQARSNLIRAVVYALLGAQMLATLLQSLRTYK